VYGNSPNSYGMAGVSTNSYGVRGTSYNSSGVVGDSTNASGVFGYSRNSLGVGGLSTTSFGVYGSSTNSNGVFGYSTNASGVIGYSPNQPGVRGYSTDSAGVFGNSINGWAGEFQGDVIVLGTLYGNKSFRIDHPLDPQNKYLQHACVESPERKNLYDGVVQLDEEGAAWVELPEWFKELNHGYRYQLTAIGAAAPQLHVAEEISEAENRFKVAGGDPGMKVCWQVTGIRKDKWAEANPFEVEQDKPEQDQGRYLYPELYGEPEESGMGRPVRDEEPLRQMEELRRQMEERKPLHPHPPVVPPPPGTDFVRRQQLPPQPPDPSSFDFSRQEVARYWRQMEELRRQMEAQLQQLEELRRRTEEGQEEEKPPEAT
jgi:hypothetical protein